METKQFVVFPTRLSDYEKTVLFSQDELFETFEEGQKYIERVIHPGFWDQYEVLPVNGDEDFLKRQD